MLREAAEAEETMYPGRIIAGAVAVRCCRENFKQYNQ